MHIAKKKAKSSNFTQNATNTNIFGNAAKNDAEVRSKCGASAEMAPEARSKRGASAEMAPEVRSKCGASAEMAPEVRKFLGNLQRAEKC